MKHYFLLFVFIMSDIWGFSQADTSRWNLSKYLWSHSRLDNNFRPIDFEVIDGWKGISNQDEIAVSPNGEFISYSIRSSTARPPDSLVVVSTKTKWRFSIRNNETGFFSSDNQKFVFKQKDKLCFLQLSSGKSVVVDSISSYKIPTNGKNDVLAYMSKKLAGHLFILNLSSGKSTSISGVVNYAFDPSNQWLLCRGKGSPFDLTIYNVSGDKLGYFQNVEDYQISRSGNELVLKISGADRNCLLQYVHLNMFFKNQGPHSASKNIWRSTDSSKELRHFDISKSGNQIVFTVKYTQAKQSEQASVNNSIWFWKEGMDSAIKTIDLGNTKYDGSYFINDDVNFVYNSDDVIQYSMQAFDKPLSQKKAGAVSLEVWSYQDQLVQTMQPQNRPSSNSFIAVFNTKNNFLIYLNNHGESFRALTDEYGLIVKSSSFRSLFTDRFWEKDYYSLDSIWILSMKTGKKSFLNAMTGESIQNDFRISPDSRYIVYMDVSQNCNYFSYDVLTGRIKKISFALSPTEFGRISRNEVLKEAAPTNGNGIQMWISGNRFLVYDNYDIWQLDASGKNSPKNLTNGFGKKHKIIFGLFKERENTHNGVRDCRFIKENTLLLIAFDCSNKRSGFFQKGLEGKGDPQLLSMNDCYFKGVRSEDNFTPLKAANSDTWVLSFQSDTEPVNFYTTTNFKSFNRVTNFQPNTGYNWPGADLHSYKLLDGSIGQGLLYKPANFDSSKKYPVVISFYTTVSDYFFQFKPPDYITSTFLIDNPAWMVSSGYLVFLPDINFHKGKWGPSTVNSVDGAARYLRQLLYVDDLHIGATGHSNSGRFGFYLLTHSKQFAAMSVGEGSTDIISAGLSLGYDGSGNLEWAENSAVGTGLGSLWENKSAWVDQSSVLSADKVSSPLLLFDNKKDNLEKSQAVEMYTALRRLDKKVWWLHYDIGGHRLTDLNEKRDWTIRYAQFYDHYLKNAPAPKWMTAGIPKYLKQIETRYELDPAATCDLPNKIECHICTAWNKQYKRNATMFSNHISEWDLDKDIATELANKQRAQRAKLDKEGGIETKRILDILKYGYPEDEKRKKSQK